MQADAELLSVEELFLSGNYTGVALRGDWDKWQTYAALGLIGKTTESLDGLSRFDHESARFYSGVALWIAGENQEAVKLLTPLQIPHARNLLKLILKPAIKVLSQLGWNSNSYLFLLSGASNDGKFDITNIDFGSYTSKNEIYADVRRYYDPSVPPDFYITQMLEWHLLPPNLQELPCPIFGQTGDYDLHIQTLPPWLQLFDDLIVTDHTEWEDVRKLAGKPVHTFPKSVSIPDSIPKLVEKERKIDFLMSGTIFHPYHPDKALLINQILDIPDLKSIIFNGFLSTYFDILQQTKISTTYVRHTAAMPSRGLEALAMGCALVVQEGNVINLFAGEAEGVVTYDLARNDVGAAFGNIIRNWPEYERRARKGAELIRRDFNSKTVASQYMRFLTFLAARPRNSRTMVDASCLEQKRSILTKGWGWPHKVYKELIRENTRRWTQDSGHADTPADINNMAREHLLDFSTWASLPTSRSYPLNSDYHHSGEVSAILDWFRQGIAKFPRSLILHFNLIRTALHFGNPSEVQEALVRAEIATAKMESYWQLSPADDVMPWDYVSQTFNYRAYFDLVTEHLKGAQPLEPRHVRLVLASINYYLGHYINQVEYLEQAAELDPEFPFYRFRLALELLVRGEAGDREKAGTLLEDLVERSMLFTDAFPLLDKLVREESFPCGKIASFRRKYRRATESMFTQNFQVDDWLDHYMRSAPTGDAGLRWKYPRTLTQLARSALNPSERTFEVGGKSKPKHILLIYQESTIWALAQHQSYSSSFGLEEALRYNGIECMMLPAYSGISPRHSASWLRHAKTMCQGKKFDQVWTEMASFDPGKEFLEWLSTLAPVRVAILPETVYQDREDYTVYQRFLRQRLVVEERLRYMTHALTTDEKDALILNARGIVYALWTPAAVPASSVAAEVGTISSGKAIYYEKECTWLTHPRLKEFFTSGTSPVAETGLPALFDTIHATVLTALHRGKEADEQLLQAYIDPMRLIRRNALALWADAIRKSPVIVNFPGPTKTYSGKALIETMISGKSVLSWDTHSGRVLEAMAAGRPVVSWEIPDRPKTKALFADGEEILLFPPARPEILAAHLARLTQDPEECARIASRALEKIRRHHTLELRVRQVLGWIESGIEPSYGAAGDDGQPEVTVGTKAARHYEDLTPALAGFNRIFNTDISVKDVPAVQPKETGMTKEERINLVLRQFDAAIGRKDVPSARRLLEDASSEFTQLNAQLAYLYFCTGDHDRSLTTYLAALSQNSCDPEVLKSIGLLSQRFGLQHEAARYFRAAMSSNPAADDVISLLESLKTIEESEADFESGLT